MIVAKLSSTRIMSEASFDTSVPDRPIAMPMLADLRATESLTPSPVIPTIAPFACSACTIVRRLFKSVKLTVSSFNFVPWWFCVCGVGWLDRRRKHCWSFDGETWSPCCRVGHHSVLDHLPRTNPDDSLKNKLTWIFCVQTTSLKGSPKPMLRI